MTKFLFRSCSLELVQGRPPTSAIELGERWKMMRLQHRHYLGVIFCLNLVSSVPSSLFTSFYDQHLYDQLGWTRKDGGDQVNLGNAKTYHPGAHQLSSRSSTRSTSNWNTFGFPVFQAVPGPGWKDGGWNTWRFPAFQAVPRLNRHRRQNDTTLTIIKETIKMQTDNQRKTIQEEQIMECLITFLALKDPNREDQDQRNWSTMAPGPLPGPRGESQTPPHLGDTYTNLIWQGNKN